MLRMSGCDRSLPTRTRFPILSDYGWLSLASSDFRQSVLDRLTIRKLAGGEALFRAGDREGGLWAIVAGGVRFELPGPQLAPGLTHVATPGFWFGEAPLIGRTPRLFDAYAAGPSVFATVSLSDFRALLDEDAARWQWIALLASMNRDLAMGVAADLLLQNPRQRVIAVLLRLSGWRTGPHLPPNLAPIHLSQQQLGQISNLSRTVVSAALRDLEERGLIVIGYRSIDVLEGAALKAMLNEH